MVVVPEPDTEKSVVVPVLPEVDDAIAKMVLVFARPELSCTESFANGEDDPIPTFPVERVASAPSDVPKIRLPMLS